MVSTGTLTMPPKMHKHTKSTKVYIIFLRCLKSLAKEDIESRASWGFSCTTLIFLHNTLVERKACYHQRLVFPAHSRSGSSLGSIRGHVWEIACRWSSLSSFLFFKKMKFCSPFYTSCLDLGWLRLHGDNLCMDVFTYYLQLCLHHSAARWHPPASQLLFSDSFVQIFRFDTFEFLWGCY